MLHTCTQAVVLPIGLSNQTANCSDSLGNVNSSQFLVNVTDNINPNVFFNITGLYYEDINNTFNININCTDNYDSSLSSFELFRNGSSISLTSPYDNGTTVTFSNSLQKGIYNFSAVCIDTFNNINRTDKSVEVFGAQANNSIIYLDGLNNTRKYELGSTDNVSANTSCVSCNVCISIDAPRVGDNISCGIQKTHYIFDITTLRQSNSTSGKNKTVISGSGVNISLDNRTDIINTSLNVSSTTQFTNLNITYVGFVK